MNGSGVDLGHPVGSMGCRIRVTLLQALKQRSQPLGLATLGGGGMSMACASYPPLPERYPQVAVPPAPLLTLTGTRIRVKSSQNRQDYRLLHCRLAVRYPAGYPGSVTIEGVEPGAGRQQSR